VVTFDLTPCQTLTEEGRHESLKSGRNLGRLPQSPKPNGQLGNVYPGFGGNPELLLAPFLHDYR
jgi:hypothetical protein